MPIRSRQTPVQIATRKLLATSGYKSSGGTVIIQGTVGEADDDPVPDLSDQCFFYQRPKCSGVGVVADVFSEMKNPGSV